MHKTTHADLTELEQTLRRQRADLLVRMRERLQLADGMAVPDWFHGIVDGATAADVALLDDTAYTQYEREFAELAQIDTALNRIEFHVAGICATCGEDIPFARLRAMPSATTCLACQTTAESVAS